MYFIVYRGYGLVCLWRVAGSHQACVGVCVCQGLDFVGTIWTFCCSLAQSSVALALLAPSSLSVFSENLDAYVGCGVAAAHCDKPILLTG